MTTVRLMCLLTHMQLPSTTRHIIRDCAALRELCQRRVDLERLAQSNQGRRCNVEEHASETAGYGREREKKESERPGECVIERVDRCTSNTEGHRVGDE